MNIQQHHRHHRKRQHQMPPNETTTAAVVTAAQQTPPPTTTRTETTGNNSSSRNTHQSVFSKTSWAFWYLRTASKCIVSVAQGECRVRIHKANVQRANTQGESTSPLQNMNTQGHLQNLTGSRSPRGSGRCSSGSTPICSSRFRPAEAKS